MAIRDADTVDNVILFFFQAEDGIRDYKVTGVQTCALPILERGRRYAVCDKTYQLYQKEPYKSFFSFIDPLNPKIGRASCREKSVDLGGRRIIKKKKEESECVVDV